MIYLKNNTEIQAIYIPRQTVLGGGYIPSTKAYDKGYNDGLEVGKEQQKGKLSNLNVTENGQYEREDGWNVVNVDVPDLNGSYNEGYEQGKAEGIDEQKAKLESISITENGVYSKEDGYNHIEVNVPSYEEGQADMAAKARVLEVTENGTYLSKFSDPIPPTLVTGMYADGTEFYNYAQLTNKVFNTNIIATPTTRLELWYKGDNEKTDDAWNIIIGAEKNPDYSCYQIRYYMYSNSDLIFELGRNNLRYSWDENAWHHILIAKETENASSMSLWVDEVKIGDFGNRPFDPQSPFYINCIESSTDLKRNANGYFGMIKIDDTIIIPTAEGFLNTNTGELLEVVKDGTYTFTENLPTYGEGELYKTINVNVPDLNGSYEQGKIDGINEQKSKLETITIERNGTYNRGDGYNKVIVKVPDYNEGYEQGHIDGYNEGYSEGEGTGYNQGQADIAENAIVLNVTENGVYKTKFSDPIMPTLVTGVYADGTEFYDYAKLKGKVFNTNILATTNSRIEFWYKGDNTLSGDAFNVIIGANYMGDSIVFEVIYELFSNSEVRARIGSSYLNTNWDENIWHHIILSKNDGFVVDGVKIGDMQNASYTSNGNFLINGNNYNNQRNANGYFGMIKIDDTIIIPTADGFKNVNTGELLEVVKNGTYTFTKNLPTYGEGEIYKTINVNVPDLNGSYDEGYAEGERAGYDQGQADISAKARVLEVTENGVYKSKYSDPIIPTTYTVTGVYADGTKFYNYAQLGNKVYNTNITVTQDSVVELWYKGDNAKTDDGWGTIFGCTKRQDEDFWMGYFSSSDATLNACLGQKRLQFSWDENIWHHIIMKNDGLWIDDALIGSFNTTKTFAYKLGLNSDGGSSIRHANGCYGMIKIDNTIIIPTADGFLNTNTGELLEVIQDGDYTFTENLPIYAEGELYKTINVNVPTVQEQSFDYDITAFTYKVYDWTSVNINRDNMTNDCGDRPLDCLLFRNRSGECTVMTKFDTCSGVVRLENGWSGNNIILSLKSNTITKFSSNSINSNQLKSIDTGFAKLEGNAITNCNALTDIKVTVLNDNLSTQFATNCFNGLPANGTITIGKNVDVTITDNEITSFFRTIVGEGWTITIK